MTGQAAVTVRPAGTSLPADVAALVAAWAPGRRWYPGTAEGSTPEPWLEVTVEGADGVVLALLRLEQPGGDAVVLHVPVVLVPVAEPAAEEQVGPGLVGTVRTASGTVAVHDGGAHPACWLALLRATGGTGAGTEADAARVLAGARTISGEQSNTSVVLPGLRLPEAPAGAMLKILRTVAAGPHPDVTVPQALTRAGYPGVPRFLGSLEASLDGVPSHLAVLSELVPEARDGFELACDLAERGEPFDALAADLGTVLARLHATMRTALPGGEPLDPARFVSGLRRRADAAVAAADALAPRAPEIAAVLDDLEHRLTAQPRPPRLQAVHGDLHLGQALHGADGWKLLDFEGEPQRPVAERTAPDLPLRDVAGILRSLDYAAAVGGARDPGWAASAEHAFLDAYRAEAGAPPGMTPDVAQAVLGALVLDKALYEVVYESRQRPRWLHIPLAAVDRVLAAA
ncbi:aminoglycoside phosphotransferase [Xylanimonas oleitrophica]|uniref:Aminoglycoside phosphotransferase n=1 Tax=Xylanimonas oleitrophica TaxID=2607479 RepID=A0A2W5WUV1_9MICO|nr:phosphotransferase [Xylanimonas oleitrophica]PZR52026.1 aminoglycoside phosphotransferase [Xylanimonas oleitrophica]